MNKKSEVTQERLYSGDKERKDIGNHKRGSKLGENRRETESTKKQK
jgi:hypothetical protein